MNLFKWLLARFRKPEPSVDYSDWLGAAAQNPWLVFRDDPAPEQQSEIIDRIWNAHAKTRAETDSAFVEDPLVATVWPKRRTEPPAHLVLDAPRGLHDSRLRTCGECGRETYSYHSHARVSA